MITEKQYLEYLIKQYQNLIYSICLKSVGNPFDAEDLTQEVFLSAYKKAAGRRSIPTEDTYFSQIPDRQSSPEDEYMKTASNTHVEALCMQLKSPYKEVAYAHFCKELSVPEIAQQTGKNPKTIQTQLYRARAMLKKMLERGD